MVKLFSICLGDEINILSFPETNIVSKFKIKIIDCLTAEGFVVFYVVFTKEEKYSSQFMTENDLKDNEDSIIIAKYDNEETARSVMETIARALADNKGGVNISTFTSCK